MAEAAAARQVLVTGATGFIGGHLVRRLRAAGDRVVALVRDPDRARARLGAEVRLIHRMAELPDTEPIDAIVNLAGERIVGPRWSAGRRDRLRASRVCTTRELVQWIGRAAHKPAVLLSASAIGWYGVQPLGDDTALDETRPPQPVFMSDLCREWEAEAAAAAACGVRVACLRFGVVLGDQGALPSMLLPVRLGLGGRLGSGVQWLSWIHLDDLLAALDHVQNRAGDHDAAWANQAGAAAIYNLVAPEPVRQVEFSRIAARVLHRPALLRTPGLPLRLLLGEQSDLLLQGQRVVPRRLLAERFVFRHPTLESALRALCARPAPH